MRGICNWSAQRDRLGFEQSLLKIEDPEFVATSGKSPSCHRDVQRPTDSRVRGMVFESRLGGCTSTGPALGRARVGVHPGPPAGGEHRGDTLAARGLVPIGAGELALRELEPARPPDLRVVGRMSTAARIPAVACRRRRARDRKSTRLNSSHLGISYAVFCLKKKK